jgi:hypothetical protein
VTAGALAQFQDAFSRALLAPEPAAVGDPMIDGLVEQPGFAVYRNTVLKGCIDALQANYPAVARLVGDEWFRATAAVFVRESLPAHPTLLDYGAGFAEFLATFAPAAGLPYLAEVARLDRLWSEAHVAADAAPLDPAAVAALGPDEMTLTRLRPHPAARWLRSGHAPIYSIWSRNRAGDAELGEIEWHGEGALLTRPHGEVLHHPLDHGGAAFLDACARGESIRDAVAAVLDVDPDAELSALIHQLLQAVTFTRLEPCDSEEPFR